MKIRTTSSRPRCRPGGMVPEEEAILARFLTRVGGGARQSARKSVGALSHGSFLVL